MHKSPVMRSHHFYWWFILLNLHSFGVFISFFFPFLLKCDTFSLSTPLNISVRLQRQQFFSLVSSLAQPPCQLPALSRVAGLVMQTRWQERCQVPRRPTGAPQHCLDKARWRLRSFSFRYHQWAMSPSRWPLSSLRLRKSALKKYSHFNLLKWSRWPRYMFISSLLTHVAALLGSRPANMCNEQLWWSVIHDRH